jgi:GTPase SAR1 family protein
MNEWIDLCQHNRNDRNIVVFMGNKADLKHERQVTQ